jgi:hypothetical protein
MWKEAVMAFLGYHPDICGETEEKHEKISVRITGLRAGTS